MSSTKTAGLLTALVFVPLSMGVVTLTKPNSTPAPNTRWASLVELAATIEQRIDRADYRRAPLGNLEDRSANNTPRASQRATSAIPHYRTAANTFDGDRAEQIWFRLMQTERDLGPDPEHQRERLLVEFATLSADALRELRTGARADNAHPAYDFQARERIDTQNMHWLATAASLEIQAQLQRGDARAATEALCDMLQVGIDCANMPYLFDFITGARVLSLMTENLLLDPAVNSAFPAASLRVLERALERIDAELSTDVAFADADLAFSLRGLEAAGYAGNVRGRMGADQDIEALLSDLVDLRAWSREHKGQGWPELHTELMELPDGLRSMGYAVMYHKLRATSLANVRLARAVVALRLHGEWLALASPTLGELEIMDGDRFGEADVEAWAVTPAAARGRWLLRFPSLEGQPRPAARALVDKPRR